MKLQDIKPFVRFARFMRMTKTSSFPEFFPCEARLFYTVDGEGEILCDGARLKMRPGCIAVINAGVPYRLLTPEVSVNYLALNFDYTQKFSHITSLLSPQTRRSFSKERLTEQIKFENAPCLDTCLYLTEMFETEAALRRIEAEYSRKVLFSDAVQSALLSDVIIAAVRQEQKIGINVGNSNKSAEILDYIGLNFRKKLTYDDLGREFNYHPNYINSLIRAATGMSLHSYLLDVRIKKAIALLDTSDKSITDVALECGFSDLAQFSKCFKKKTSLTPSQYRWNG